MRSGGHSPEWLVELVFNCGLLFESGTYRNKVVNFYANHGEKLKLHNITDALERAQDLGLAHPSKRGSPPKLTVAGLTTYLELIALRRGHEATERTGAALELTERVNRLAIAREFAGQIIDGDKSSATAAERAIAKSLYERATNELNALVPLKRTDEEE